MIDCFIVGFIVQLRFIVLLDNHCFTESRENSKRDREQDCQSVPGYS